MAIHQISANEGDFSLYFLWEKRIIQWMYKKYNFNVSLSYSNNLSYITIITKRELLHTSCICLQNSISSLKGLKGINIKLSYKYWNIIVSFSFPNIRKIKVWQSCGMLLTVFRFWRIYIEDLVGITRDLRGYKRQEKVC